MNYAITRYIQGSTEMTGCTNSMLYARRGQAQRGSYNNRVNYRGRGNGRGYYNNNYNRKNGQINNSYHNNNNKEEIIEETLEENIEKISTKMEVLTLFIIIITKITVLGYPKTLLILSSSEQGSHQQSQSKFIRNCSGPLSGESGPRPCYPTAPLSRSSALSLSRSVPSSPP